MASAERALLIKILGDAKDLVDAAKRAEGGLDKLKSAAKIAGGALVASFAATKVVDFLGDSTRAAAEDAQQQKLLAQTVSNVTGANADQIASMEAFINKVQNSTGVLDDQLRPALQNLIVATKSVEGGQALMGTAMDIATAKGIDLETVTKAMAKAHDGNSAALAKLGIATKDAAGNALSFDQIMQNANATFGGATAAAADTAAGKMAIASAKFSDVKEQIGTALIPIMAALADFVSTRLIPAFEAIVAWIQENWPKIHATIVDTFEKVKGYVVPVIETIRELWQKFGDDILRIAKGTWDAIAGQIRTGIAVIQAIVQPIVDILHGDWGKAWDDFSRRIAQAWDGIKQTVTGAVGVLTGVLDGLVTAIAGLGGKIADAAVGMFDGIWNAFKGVINKVIDTWNAFLRHIGIHVHADPLGRFGPAINFDWQMPEVPRLAKGGIVTGPTLAMIGERGPEAVLPLSGGAGVGTTINIYNPTIVANDPRSLVEQLKRYEQTNGVVPVRTL